MGRALFDSIRSIPEVRFDVREDAFALLDVFDELASHLLCVEHAIHYQSLRSQWIWEFGRRRIEILSELEKYYGRINHGDEDEDNSDDGEKSDTSLTQSLTITEFKKLCPEIKEEEVARKVTKKLEQNVGEQGKLTGCVYIISPNDTEFHGMLKIGCTKVHPEVSRFAPHNRCLGSFETIAVRPVTYAQRVEQLLLAEFSHARYSKKCRKCGRVHNEWLEIKVDVIVKSLDKWCDFFSKFSPYKKDGRLGTLAEEVILPPPVSREYFSPRSANSTPLKNTSSVKDSMGKGSRKKNSAKKAPAEKTPKKELLQGKNPRRVLGRRDPQNNLPQRRLLQKALLQGFLQKLCWRLFNIGLHPPLRLHFLASKIRQSQPLLSRVPTKKTRSQKRTKWIRRNLNQRLLLNGSLQDCVA
ncbi:uncharacterized protein N7458_006175 [Penicillium daleae]|uniref:Bacteriophage T5 Orf172 DNA-binding domain-containing protein n=1 Tax=Penicillium daleae TaxID=63821 RepID=A0AAD6G2P7_9EURO|nr:uncharacterized protein N7458_006175 [Penicillium daleae]KAJ5449726.1 hypothetical protein N7458_006175 [Penicillium daleae]